MPFLPGERERKPMTLGAVADVSFEAYGARLGLYAGAAAAFFVLQIAVELVTHGAGSAVMLTNILADAAIAGLVANGVAATIAGEAPGARALIDRTLERLWAFLTLGLAGLLVTPDPLQLFGPAADSFYGFAIVPTLFIAGAVQLPIVAAALETAAGRGGLVGTALVRTITIAFRLQAFLRISVLGIVAVAELILSRVLYDVLHAHGVHDAMFWAGNPLDALVTGPIAAFATVLYLDLRRRAER